MLIGLCFGRIIKIKMSTQENNLNKKSVVNKDPKIDLIYSLVSDAYILLIISLLTVGDLGKIPDDIFIVQIAALGFLGIITPSILGLIFLTTSGIVTYIVMGEAGVWSPLTDNFYLISLNAFVFGFIIKNMLDEILGYFENK